MIWVQFLALLAFIFIGARIGSMGIAYAGGAGVLFMGLLGLEVDPSTGIPWTVLGIIMAVIAAVAAMQAAGGLDYLVSVVERVLRKNPQRINFYAPIITYLMTLLCGTGHVAFSSLPVIAEVAKEQKIRPSRALASSVVSSQVAIAASPISAAVLAMVAVLEPMGVSYLTFLFIAVITTFVGCMVGAFVSSKLGSELKDDPVYQDRLAKGLVKKRDIASIEIKPGAKRAVGIFLVAIVVVIVYATMISEEFGIVPNPPFPRDAAIMGIMLLAGLIITLTCKADPAAISGESTFKGGMSAAACILGVAWVGNTFVAGHMDVISEFGSSAVQSAPWLLAVVLFFASALLYSQGATSALFMPLAASIGVAPWLMVASFPAVTGLYLLPTYPTTVAAIEMDDTGSTRIGKWVFNHPFLIPGVVSVLVAVLLGFVLAPIFI